MFSGVRAGIRNTEGWIAMGDIFDFIGSGMNWRRVFLGGAVIWGVGVTSGFCAETNAVADLTNALPEIVVVAQKEPAPAQAVPVSVTPVSRATLDAADVNGVGEAAVYAPNVHVAEFTARTLSVPYLRGLGGSPANSAVTTFYDGVPQLHGYSANREWLDVDQVEFVRGAQGLFFGRNTLGGVITVWSRPPPSDFWQGQVEAGYGNYNARETRFRVGGPLEDQWAFSLAGGYTARDGFTENDLTGEAVDSREALSGQIQLQWNPDPEWTARFILFAERDRDGDYALGDLAALRRQPRRVQRDFEGFTDRDILAPTLAVERQGDTVHLTLISGWVDWQTHEMTDLDYSPLPAVVRNAELDAMQFSQEVRLASPADTPVELSDTWKLKWQGGVFVWTQNVREDSENRYGPSVLDPQIAFPVIQTSPRARLDDEGVGVYGQTTWIAADVWELGAGLRGDLESKAADLRTFSLPPLMPSTDVDETERFSHVSPQVSLAYVVAPEKRLYAVASQGYRAGGFNPVAPPGETTYQEETSWQYETGLKSEWWDQRLMVNLAAFYIDWRDLQLNLPLARTYYVDNSGDAYGQGFELEVQARLSRGVTVFGALGYLDARFQEGATSLRTDAWGQNSLNEVGGNRLPYAPTFTALGGAQMSVPVSSRLEAYGRVEVAGVGRYAYSAANTENQEAYTLVNVRTGLRHRRAFCEGWINNVFDTEYVPVAFEYPNYQSGFLGESGAPLTFGVRAGFYF